MRNVFALVLIAAVAAFATAPSYSAVDAVYELVHDTTFTMTDSSISNAADPGADSITICTKFPIETGWEYILTHATVSGGDGDASEIKLALMASCLDTAGNQMAYFPIDTFTATTSGFGEAYLLSFGGSVIANYVTLYWATRVVNGDDAAIIMPAKQYLYKRRPVTITKGR